MEWQFPIHLPRFTDKEYEIKKAEYVAKHGYYISPPKLSDIIHIRLNNEPNDEEFSRYDKARRLHYLINKYPVSKSVPQWRTQKDSYMTPRRFDDIHGLMQRKRDKFNAMKASPIPTWLSNAGSAMTFFDDVNDMAGTIGVLGRIAAHFVPRVLGKIFLGPVGWLFLIADIFSIIMALTKLPISCIVSKRHFHSATELNPFSQSAKARRAKKLRKFLPGKGELIEAAQVTDQLFGIGLCLGPIVGFAEDIVSGTVRTLMGQKVSWHGAPPNPSTPERHAMRTLRFAQAVGLAHHIMSEDEHWLYLIALNGATQVLKPYFDVWDPFDQVEGLENVLFRAPEPRRATTKAILAEFGVLPGEKIGWPGLNKREATAEELWDYYQKPSAESFMDFCVRNRRNQVGSTGAQNAFEFANNMLMFASGPETVDVEYEPAIKGWYDYYSNGCIIEGAGGTFRLGSFRYQWSYYALGNTFLQIATSCAAPRKLQFGAARRGMFFETRTCRLWVDTSWSKGSCKDHVFNINYRPMDDNARILVAKGVSDVIVG